MISRYASLRQGLVGAWCPSLGASGFRLIDRSGYNNHGVLTNMDPGTDWVASGSGLALDFDGSNDYVSARQTFTTNSISISAWAKAFANASTFGYIVDLSTNLGVVSGIGTNADATQVRWVLNDGSGASICDLSVSNPANKINHWVGTWNGSSAVFYLNGVQASSATSTKILSTAAQNIYIGLLRSADRFLLGQVDDVRLYNRALTPSEIQLLYTGGRGFGLAPERIKHRRKTTAAAFKAAWARRQQHIGSGVY